MSVGSSIRSMWSIVPACRSLWRRVPTPWSQLEPSTAMPEPKSDSPEPWLTVAVFEPVQLKPPNEYQVWVVVSSTENVASPPAAGTAPAGICTWNVPGVPPAAAVLVMVTNWSDAVPVNMFSVKPLSVVLT
ncbi:MAG TPA: hypothetical protein DDZ81_26145 [Acetobacteraceae bacterium]|nr:hypothetical protein [Acetobacteraceae bacterium]